MRDPFESLIPLNGCKGTTFFANHQTFTPFFCFLVVFVGI